MKRTAARLWIAALMLLAAAAAPALAKSYRAESHFTAMQILDNGDLHVTERFRFRFIGGPFTQTYRTLPRRGTDGIEVEAGSDSMQVTSGRVVWHFPACGDTVREFTLVYRVRGALRSEDAHRVLDWRAFSSERQYAIEAAVARVAWPARWPEPSSVRAGQGKVRTEREPHAVVFHAGRLSRERALRLYVEFPAAGITAPLPAWQARELARRQHLVISGGLALAVLGLGITLVLLLYRELAPHRPPGQRNLRHGAPPSDMSPALAGVLVAGAAGFQHLIACIADLAARGHLEFATALSKRWWGGGEYVIRRRKHVTGLAVWEQAVLGALARHEEAGAISWSRALVGLRACLVAFRVATRAELLRRGDFDPHAGERPRALHSVAAIAGTFALAAFVVTAWQWRNWGPGTVLPGIALVIVVAVAMAAAVSLPRHTPAGFQRAMAWRGFAAHLQDLAKRPQPLDAQQFQAWFPYALALGAGPAWIQAGKKWKLEVPVWFRVPGAESMAGFAAVFAGATAAPSGASTTSGGAGGGSSGAH